MTGNQRVLAFLSDRRWYTAAEIEAGCEVTCHSRISELRAAGNVIEKRLNAGATGRRKFSYRLVRSAAERLLEDDAISETSERAEIHQGRMGARDGECGAAAVQTSAAAPEPFDDDRGDAGWRDLFPAESAREALPPPAEEQLVLGPAGGLS